MKNLKRPEQLELDAMSRADLYVFIMQLFDVLEKLDSRLVDVEKNSKNSSKPPSSDGLRKGAAQPRQVGAKPTGGQKGHQGVTREMVENPDVIEALYPIADVCECGSPLDKKSARLKERRQQIEIPEPITITTEYRKMAVQCQCGRIQAGEFPSNVTPHVSFGARLKSYCVGLTHGHFVAIERVSEIVNDQYGVQPYSVHEKRGYLVMDAAGILPTTKALRFMTIGNLIGNIPIVNTHYATPIIYANYVIANN
jgi:transposase